MPTLGALRAPADAAAAPALGAQRAPADADDAAPAALARVMRSGSDQSVEFLSGTPRDEYMLLRSACIGDSKIRRSI